MCHKSLQPAPDPRQPRVSSRGKNCCSSTPPSALAAAPTLRKIFFLLRPPLRSPETPRVTAGERWRGGGRLLARNCLMAASWNLYLILTTITHSCNTCWLCEYILRAAFPTKQAVTANNIFSPKNWSALIDRRNQNAKSGNYIRKNVRKDLSLKLFRVAKRYHRYMIAS